METKEGTQANTPGVQVMWHHFLLPVLCIVCISGAMGWVVDEVDRVLDMSFKRISLSLADPATVLAKYKDSCPSNSFGAVCSGKGKCEVAQTTPKSGGSFLSGILLETSGTNLLRAQPSTVATLDQCLKSMRGAADLPLLLKKYVTSDQKIGEACQVFAAKEKATFKCTCTSGFSGTACESSGGSDKPCSPSDPSCIDEKKPTPLPSIPCFGSKDRYPIQHPCQDMYALFIPLPPSEPGTIVDYKPVPTDPPFDM